MARNTDRPNNGRTQVIYSAKRKIFKEKYLTPKGVRLLNRGRFSKEEIWKLYGKNRYTINPEAKPVKQIKHIV